MFLEYIERDNYLTDVFAWGYPGNVNFHLPFMYKCCINNSIKDNNLVSSVHILTVITESNRIRILCVLSQHELCVCELAKIIGISRNLLSFHLKKLFKIGILTRERAGNKIFFKINPAWRVRIEYLFHFLTQD